MRDARPLLILAGASIALSLSGCAGEQEPETNQVITDINAAKPGDIEAVPPDESVDPLPIDNGASGEETGDGDDMVNVIDDTGNRT
jgi:type IV pilus biogenesis protein CpaD/CtpE